MVEYPRYEVTVRTKLFAIIYAIAGFAIITALLLYVFLFYDRREGYIYLIYPIVTVAFSTGITYICFNRAYISNLPKTIVIDGRSFTIIQKGQIKERIYFKNIVEIRSHLEPFFPVFGYQYGKVSIWYKENGRLKTYLINQEVIPIKWLKMIFRELYNVALIHNIPVTDNAYWLHYPYPKRRLRDKYPGKEMVEYPRYQVTVRTRVPTIIYFICGIGLIFVVSLVVFGDWGEDIDNIKIIITLVLLCGGAIIAFYVAYIISLPKTVIIDGQSFTILYNGRLRKQILFWDIVEIRSQSPIYDNPWTVYFSNRLIKIIYREYGMEKTYEIREEIIPKKWLRLIFLEIYNVALLHHIPVKDPAHWLIYPYTLRERRGDLI